MNRSQMAFALGARTEVLMSLMPELSGTYLNLRPYLMSLSRMDISAVDPRGLLLASVEQSIHLREEVLL